VRNLAGRVVLEKTGLSGDKVDLDLENVGSGVYFVILQLEGVRVMGRFVKM
jgi:hypothetical protein